MIDLNSIQQTPTELGTVQVAGRRVNKALLISTLLFSSRSSAQSVPLGTPTPRLPSGGLVHPTLSAIHCPNLPQEQSHTLETARALEGVWADHSYAKQGIFVSE